MLTLLFPSSPSSLSKGSQPPRHDMKRCSSLLFSLNFAASVARDFFIPVPEEWVECAKKVKVPFDAVRKYHPEYDGYSPGELRTEQSRSLPLSFQACKRGRMG